MGLDFLNNDNENDNENNDESELDHEDKMTFGDATKFLMGEIDVHDDDALREKIGQAGVENVKAIEKITDELTAIMKTILRKKAKGDKSVTLDLFILAQRTKAAVNTLSPDQIASLIATGVAAIAQIEVWMEGRTDDED